jgi:hypothetical protein
VSDAIRQSRSPRGAVRSRAPRFVALALGAAALLLGALPSAARAQEYRVYEWEQPYEGWLEPAYWTTWHAQSKQSWQHFGDSTRMQGVVRHTAELEYGATDNLTGEVYLDGESAPGHGFDLVQTRVAMRYHFFQRYVRWFNPALYLEYYVPRKKYDASQKLEARFILDHDSNDFRLALNPMVEWSTSTDSVRSGFRGGFAGALYWRRFYAVQPAIEYFTEGGPLGDTPRAGALDQRLFTSAYVRFAERWVWNVGVGWGLTNEADRVTVKSILSVEFPTAQPANVRR